MKPYLLLFLLSFICFNSAQAQPSNNDCANPIVLPISSNFCSTVGQYTNVAATPSGYGAATCFSAASNDVWFSFTCIGTDVNIVINGNQPPSSGGTLLRPEVALYSGTCGGTINELQCGSAGFGTNIISIYRGGLVIGQTYFIRVQGNTGNTGTFQICAQNYNAPASPGSDCATASVLCDKSPFVVQSVTGAGLDPDEALNSCIGGLGGNSESNSTWFKWTCDVAGSLEFVLSPTNAADDLDFVLYELPNGINNCNGKIVQRCMASSCFGPTGLNATSVDITEPPGCLATQDNFVAALNLVSGTSYALLINNFSSTGNGFSISFGGTSTFLGPTADFTTVASTNNCVSDTWTFTDISTFPLGSIIGWNWTFGTDATPATANTQGPHTVTYSTPGQKSVVLSVESALGCIVTQVVLIDVLAPNVVVDNIIDEQCPGASDGAIDITGTGGPLTYLWSNGATTDDISGLASGIYTVTVTDTNNCGMLDTVIVAQNTGISLVVDSITGAACSASTGAIYTTSLGGPCSSSQVVLNEIMPRPPLGNGVDPNTGEYIELIGPPGADISCYVLTDGDWTITIPPGTTIPADGIFTIGNDIVWGAGFFDLDAENCACFTEGTTGSGAGLLILTDGGEYVALFDGTGTFLQGLIYGSPSGVNTPPNGAFAAAGVISTIGTPGCPGSVTIPGAIAFETTSASYLTDTALVRQPDGTGSWASQGGGSPNACNSSTGGSSIAYLWSNGATTEDITGLTSGTYFVTITNGSGCSFIDTVVVPSTNTSVLVPVDSIDNISCNGNTDGSIYTTGTGGGLTYLWSNGMTTEDISGLGAGVYTATVTDSNSCVITTSATITEPSAVTATISSSTTVTCNGGNDGTATAAGSGGSGGTYNFLWPSTANNQTTGVATGLTAGIYTVTVTDSNSCASTSSVTITEGTAVVVNIISQVNTSCNGGSDGTATALGSNGVGTIGYSWSAGGQTSATAVGLSAGTYIVTASDGNNCSAIDSVTIFEPTAVTATIASLTNVSCNGGSNGTATAAGAGGTGAYTFLWIDNQTTATAIGLVSGSYSVTVSDGNSCPAITSVTITQPSAVSVTASISSNYNGASISCNGACDGAISTTSSGGTGVHSYLWSDGQTTAIGTGLCAGGYSVTASDGNNCQAVTSVTITDPPAVSATSSSTNALCNGSSDGTATAVGLGGVGSYTFVWSTIPVQTTSIATGLDATTNGGIYSATVSDGNGCSVITTVTITEPTQVSATVSVTQVTCNGGDDGTATATAIGGTAGVPPLPTYTYDWGNGPTAVSTSPGSPFGTAGVHTVTISDDNGCSITESYTLTEPSAMSFTIASTDVSCNGGNDGTTSINVSGGVGGFTYLWNDGQTTATATGLTAGTHCVTATDGNGCTVDTCMTIIEPTALGNVSFTAINVQCFGDATGQLTVSLSGGIQPYSYLWANGQTGNVATNLDANVHSVTITDANGCSITDNGTVTQPTQLQISLNVDSVSCKGGNDGQITATTTGGTFPYTYLWDAAAGNQNTAIATGLTTGTYSVTATDFNNCIIVSSAFVSEPLTPLTASIIAQSDPTCNGGSNGSIEVDAQGATPNYTYQWSNGQTSSLASGIAAGAHTVTVTDANGCSISVGGVLSQPSPIALNPQILSNYNGAAISCAGGSDGSVGVTAAGGTGVTYTYLWSPLGQNTATINGLFAGTYCVTVSDVEGCQADTCIVLNDPVPLAATFTKVDILCNGDNNGQILVNATPGTGTLGVNGYEYKITGPGQTGNVYSSINSYSNLVAGAYDVFVRDGNGCNVQLSIQIDEPDSVLIDSVVVVDALCFGTATGTATAHASGGVGNFSYAWSGTANGQTTQMATGLAIGLYNVTVSDANGCDRVQIFNVGEASPLVGSITAGTISCMGGVTTATASASGGTPINTNTYLYNWSNGITSATTIGLTAGIHCVTITDANACTTIECVTITEPSTGISAIISAQTDALCQGTATGTATAQGVGGTSPYTYLWNNNAQTTQTATGLMVGVYTVSVTDTNGCPATAMVTITEPTAVAAVVVNATSTSCNGQSDGSAMAIGSGGTPGYTYLWSSGETTQTATGLAGGAQTVTLTDANGCTTTAVTNIIDPPAIQITALNTTDVSCKGDATGTANIAVQGGNPIGGYIYQWSSTSQGGAIVSGLSAGSHSVTVSDINGCSVVGTFTIGEPTDALTGYLTSADALCFGSATGELGAVIQGGTSATGSYNYLWNTTPVQSTVVADSLLAGTYTVTITDDNLCSLVLTGSLGEASQLSVTASVQQNVSCYGGSNGVAIANTATGGTPNYSYVWTDPTGQSTQVATNLMAGPVTVVVTDNNACTASATVTITEAAEITASANINHVSCNGGSDGSITISSSSVLVNYAWSAGIGNPLSGLTAGTYDLTVTDNFTCTETFSYTVTEPDVMSVTIAQTGDILCNGDNNGQAEVTAIGGTPNYSYNWTNGSNNSTASNLTPGTHMVTVMDSKGCSETVTISIAEPEALTITGTTTGTLCAGDETGSIAAFGSGGTTMGGLLQYSVDGTNWQSGNIFSGLTPGIHILSVQDQNGCTVDTSLVIEDADPFFITSMTADTLIEYLDSMLVYAMVNDTVDVSINWSIISGAGTVVDSVYSFAIAPEDPVDYLFTATNANGCTVDSILMVDVKKPRRANAPMAFTPNGDGVNDYFFIQGGAKVKTVTLFRVYDRWGELVFEGSDLDINASTQGWDGNFRGQQSASGAYIWYAEVEFKDGHKEILKGDVLLIR